MTNQIDDLVDRIQVQLARTDIHEDMKRRYLKRVLVVFGLEVMHNSDLEKELKWNNEVAEG